MRWQLAAVVMCVMAPAFGQPGPRPGPPPGPEHRPPEHGPREHRPPEHRPLSDRPGERGMPTPEERMAYRMRQYLSEEERAEVMEFLKQHSPNRYEFLSASDSRGRLRILHRAIEKYRMMERFRDHDPELYQRLLERFAAEDQIFALLKARQEGDSAVDEQLRDKVREVVASTLRERQRRIEKLEQQIELEKRRLEADEENIERLVDMQLERIQADHENETAPPDGYRDRPPPSQPVGAAR